MFLECIIDFHCQPSNELICVHICLSLHLFAFHVFVQVLDYFTQQRHGIQDDHIIYRFEISKEFGIAEQNLYTQLCDQIGFDKNWDVLPLYMTGEDSVLIDNYPEIAFFRDIVYLFKMMMAPTSDMLPPIKYWTYKDAALKWSWKDKSTKQSRAAQEIVGKLKVAGFGGHMKILGYDSDAHDAAMAEKLKIVEERKQEAAAKIQKKKPLFTRFASRFRTKKMRCV